MPIFLLNMNYKQKVGSFGEKIARDFLIKNGYTIIARNLKLSYQEIDIIASIKEKMVFIEVKTRTSGIADMAESAINMQKIKNMKKAIASYVYLNKLDLDCAQFDVIAVNINKMQKIAKIKHYKEIF